MLLPCLLALASYAAAQDDSKLLLTQVVWTHGSSTPAKLIPSDTENVESTWVEGLASLTQRGREEAFKLGTLLNARYVTDLNLISDQDAHRKVYVRSAECNRTLSTAYAVMAGLIPLSPKDLGTKDWPLYWQPFPVHSVPAPYDALLDPELRCPKADERIPAKLVGSPVFQDHDNLHFLEFILKKSGFEELTWETLYDIYSALESTKDSTIGNHTWPLWMDGEGFGKLKHLVDFSAAAAYADETVSRLKGGGADLTLGEGGGEEVSGPLLKEMLERMETKVSCLQEAGSHCKGVVNLGMYGYSADPLLVHSLLTGLGLVTGSLPGHGAALALELWERPGDEFEVRALYYDGLGGVPKLREFSIGGCPELNCTLEAFRERSSVFLPWNWERECGLLTKGLSAECEAEVDNSETQSCQDWATHNLCVEQPAVRFVFCRKTCLCDDKYAKKTRKFRLI